MGPQTFTFFERGLPWIDAEHYSDDGMIRSMRHYSQPRFLAEMYDHVGLSIHTSPRFHSRRKTGAHHYSDAAAVGRAFLDGPGSRIEIETEGESRLIQFRMPRPQFDHIMLEDHDRTQGFAALRPLQGEVDFELLRLMAKTLLSDDAGVRQVMMRAVVARLVAVHDVRQTPEPRRGLTPARLRRVRDLLASDLANVTLNAMATEAGLSLYHFAREFRHETGQTPWNFVVQSRVWEAVRLLGNGGMAPDAIAEQVGFSHASHMGRSFRKILGVTPGSIRNRLLA